MAQITRLPFLPGTYRGTGIWHDRTKATGSYSVEHRYEVLPEGAVLQTTHRQFLNSDGSVQYEEHSTVLFSPEEYPFLHATVKSGGAEIGGPGYCYGNLVHYGLIISDTNALENTYQVGTDVIRLNGSATNNGKPTVWEEHSHSGR
ncbi:MAG TPA: hypothetical protein VHI13_19250 [Candidatus Kapabacteria bacterium]|nr:hypothetical protein [Candidatus Kapabacteria bacterium]